MIPPNGLSVQVLQAQEPWPRTAQQWDKVLNKSSMRLRPKRIRVFFIWIGPPKNFSLRCRRAIESVFFHHPDALVSVYSNDLPQSMFDGFTNLGYDLVVQRYDFRALLLESNMVRVGVNVFWCA